MIDLGYNHSFEFSEWAPDRDINPQYKDIPDIKPIGLILYHTKKDGTPCEGSIMFDLPHVKEIFQENKNRPLWKVESLEPLTLSPFFEMSCLWRPWIYPQREMGAGMKKEQRQIYRQLVDLAHSRWSGLCNICRYAEFSGSCEDGDLECHCGIYKIEDERYDDAWSGSDCWAFRPQ